MQNKGINSFDTMENRVKKSAVRNFWKYTVILCLSAILLISIAGVIQTVNYRNTITDVATQSEDTKSILQNVRDQNNQLKTDLDKAKKDLINVEEGLDDKITENVVLSNQIYQMQILIDTQNYLLTGNKRLAREEFSKFEYIEIMEEFIPMYNYLKGRI